MCYQLTHRLIKKYPAPLGISICNLYFLMYFLVSSIKLKVLIIERAQFKLILQYHTKIAISLKIIKILTWNKKLKDAYQDIPFTETWTYINHIDVIYKNYKWLPLPHKIWEQRPISWSSISTIKKNHYMDALETQFL